MMNQPHPSSRTKHTVMYYIAAAGFGVLWFIIFAHSPWVSDAFLHPFHLSKSPLFADAFTRQKEADFPPFKPPYLLLLFIMVATTTLTARILRKMLSNRITPGTKRDHLEAAVKVLIVGQLVFCAFLVVIDQVEFLLMVLGDISSPPRGYEGAFGVLLLLFVGCIRIVFAPIPVIGGASLVALPLILLNAPLVIPCLIATYYIMRRLVPPPVS